MVDFAVSLNKPKLNLVFGKFFYDHVNMMMRLYFPDVYVSTKLISKEQVVKIIEKNC